MKLALFGANGMAGTKVSEEAWMRGYYLTAIVRDPARLRKVLVKLKKKLSY